MEIRAGYKRTEVGVIPKDWNTPPIGSICKLVNGRGFKPYEWEKAGLPIIRIQNLNGSVEFNYFQGSYDPKIEVDTGQLLFAWSGSRGTSFGPHVWQGSLALLNYHTWKIQSYSDKVDNIFFFHALKQLTSSIEGRAHGASALVHTQKWEMEGFKIPLPPTLEEQMAIAGALSDVDGLILSLETLITKKRNIKQGAMQELLRPKEGWVEKKLGEIVEIVMGQSPSSSNYNTKRHGLPLIQGNADILDRKTIKRIYTTHITKLGKHDDIIMTVRAPVGEISITLFNVCLGRGVCAIRGANSFIYHLLVSKEPSWAKLSKGSTFDSVNSEDVKTLEVSLPLKMSEQTAIANILSDMDAEIVALKQKLTKIRQIKQGMMSELLTGQIRLVASQSVEDEIVVQETPSQNWAFKEAVIIASLADQFGTTQFPLGRKRCTKLTYLMHRKAKLNTDGYLKKAAGPYNPNVRYSGPETLAQKKKYICSHKSGTYTGFISGESIAEAKFYFSKWYGQDMSDWLNQFRYKKNDDLEVLATVDMAMVEVCKSGEAATLETVKHYIANEPEWAAKLEREAFCDSNIINAIQTCTDLFGDTASTKA